MITAILISTLVVAGIATTIGTIVFVRAALEERSASKKAVHFDLTPSNRVVYGAFAVEITKTGLGVPSLAAQKGHLEIIVIKESPSPALANREQGSFQKYCPA